MENSKMRPYMKQVEPWGDFVLACPNCNRPIIFPLINNVFPIYDERPKNCMECGVELDWGEDNVNY